MKKAVAIILCIALLVPLAVVPASAQTVKTETTVPTVKTADSLDQSAAGERK